MREREREREREGREQREREREWREEVAGNLFGAIAIPNVQPAASIANATR